MGLDKKNIKRLGKVFVFLFLVILIVVNWNRLSPVLYYFDWRVIGAKIASLLPQTSFNLYDYYFGRQAQLKIPGLDVAAPIIFARESDRGELEKLLKRGVVHYPGSGLPGKPGKMVILGHSAPPRWPKINYDWVFSGLNKLEEGDKVTVDYQGWRYVYRVADQFIFSPEEEEQFLATDRTEKSVLVLSTCWPPGKDYKRLVLMANLE